MNGKENYNYEIEKECNKKFPDYNYICYCRNKLKGGIINNGRRKTFKP